MKFTITDEFGKTIDIDMAIDTLRDVRHHRYDGTSYEVRLASLMAIAIMQKYQKIEQIVKNTQQLCSYGSAFIDIREVIEE